VRRLLRDQEFARGLGERRGMTRVLEFRPADAAESSSRPRSPSDERALTRARRVMALAFGAPAERGFAVRYWTGDEEPAQPALDRGFRLVIRSPDALRRMLLPPSELAFAEAFISGDIDVEGDLLAAVELGASFPARFHSIARMIHLTWQAMGLPRSRPSDRDAMRAHARTNGGFDDRDRAASAIRHHYDVGNDFYALWLDPERVYSCAYFASPDQSLEDAQHAKLDLICQKLHLAPGERLLDIGCGWGGLIRHAVRYYGVEALGVTLSQAQADYARERIEREGLGDRCRVEIRDYRDLHREGSFDKVASVGMFQHVGRARMRSYFRTVFDLTRPGGLFLNHGIVDLEQARDRSFGSRVRGWLWREDEFIDRYVFPDGELVSLAYASGLAEKAGFETRDVGNLREHYALTLAHWVRRLEAHEAEAIRLVGETTYRIWRLYLTAAEQSFRCGRASIVQMVLARRDGSGQCVPPLTRERHPHLRIVRSAASCSIAG
jgi:cyclopropane-fatty-acyl-phospholipid synthase